ncbi:MAG: hypothetical protein NTY19_36100 [Planctomycetota bacterium]|nr:hypothetical protein [Planctomycetota bacterium]
MAPLELVLALPILLMVAALFVNLGTMATWRVRGEVIARDAAWRARWPRTGGQESPPRTWPAGAKMQRQDDARLTELDIPEMRYPVVRGPLPNGFWVSELLAPDRGAAQGIAAVTRRYPLLPRLGQYRSGDIQDSLLDLKWPCSEMSLPNVSHRSLRLYQLPKTDRNLPAALANAGRSLLSIPHRLGLSVLDHDDDVRKYRGYYADFYPWIQHPYPGHTLVDLPYCQLDAKIVYEKQVTPLIDTLAPQGQVQLGQISKLPRTLTNFFLNMYEQEINRLNDVIRACDLELAQLAALERPTPETRQRQAELLAMKQRAVEDIARIEPNLEPLRAYRDRLPEIEQGLRAQAEQEGL